MYYARGRSVHAVDDVSFDVPAGSTMGLVGESGCGKSATALSVMRMIPPTAGEIVSGSILLQGADVMRMSPKELRRVRGGSIGFIPQDPLSSLNPLMTVGEQVAEVLQAHRNASRSAARRTAIELLDRVGIPKATDRLKDYPHQFSGGMRQRVAIAMAIACDPVVLLADEPTTALDVTMQAQILELLKRLSAENGMAIVLITHDLGVAANMCDSIRVMYAGQIVEEAEVDDFFYRPMTPYARGLMAALPSAAPSTNGRLNVIPGTPPSLADLPAGCRFSARCAHRHTVCQETEQVLTQRDRPGHTARCVGTDRGGWI
ncbi:ABC transporter ATP-binding protein [Dactylosporangium fulvum]|uniref:ABC transporter ATP-binding protein n=1 Tax=Dactylosporangium fulvum TaxID=53359 RepID=A0ABY5WBF5_9ACTN|nr:ABC transporter ATP-binding protein [Dactylosporangium fulvum]UWP86799.1 ABC transporter ATP-binding protein [Dactylosporangium fulvum]